MDSYTTSIEINSTKESVFQAMSKDLKNWWGKQDVPISKINASSGNVWMPIKKLVDWKA